MSMTELQQNVAELTPHSLILLMSFNRDRNNDVFSYQESIDLVAAHARHPIYGLWDFTWEGGLWGECWPAAGTRGAPPDGWRQKS